MDKVLGIVAEYNPFHNGHLYQLNYSKKITNSKYSVAVISGNFTQRGSTSLIDKWSKAEIAIKNGIDLVIELPLLYPISSAENFADGAVKILNSLGIVDYISFGTESGDISSLKTISDILVSEPEKYKSFLTAELNMGLSFPKARENALSMYFHNSKVNANILSSPNNILGVEYLKALKKYNSSIIPLTLKRTSVDYNETTYKNDIASSTAIRNIVKNKKFDILSKVIPQGSFSLINENIKNGHIVPDLSVFEKEIIYNLRKMSIKDISNLPDVNEGLEYSIKKAVNSCNTIDELLSNIKSKRYTITRLQRILLYSLLEITKDDMDISKKITPYIRILGFNNNGKYLLSKIVKENPNLEIITSVKKFLDSSNNYYSKKLLKKDILATNIYTLGYAKNSNGNLDYTHKIIVI